MTDLAHDRLLRLCEDLKLPGVAAAWPALAASAVEQGASLIEFLEEILIAERDFRRVRSTTLLTRMAGFPAVKTLEDV